MNIDSDKQFAAFFQEAADAADAIARGYFRQPIPVEDKQDKSPVTKADREIEQKLREMIECRFSGHGIIGEEFGKVNENAEFVWCIDPIDGTKSFITGRPLFGTVLGLLHEGKPVMGLVSQAYTRERWFGVAGKNATHNGQPIRVAEPRSLDHARLYTGSISMFEGENFDRYLKLCRLAKLAQQGCDCYIYGLLAMGMVDVTAEQCLKLYDLAGIVPIITGAGGFISDWEENPIDIRFNGRAVAASSRELALEVLAILNMKP